MRATRTHRRTWLLAGLFCIVLGGIIAGFAGASAQFLARGGRALASGQANIISNPSAARADFLLAADWFTRAELVAKGLDFAPPFSWEVRAAQAGLSMTAAGEQTLDLLATYPEAVPLPSAAEGDDSVTALSDYIQQSSSDFLNWYAANESTVNEIAENVSQARQSLERIPESVSLVSKAAKEATVSVRKADVLLSTLRQSIPVIRTYLERSTTLLIFQNDGEQRPSGGFIGSYAVLENRNGRIENFSFGSNVYKLDASFTARTKLQPPKHLGLITPTWAFRDSNVGEGFLDQISKQVRSFFFQATDGDPTTIFYLDTSVLEDVLRLTGPVTLTEQALTLDADTVADALDEYVTKTYFTSSENKAINEPKSVIADLIPVLIRKIQADRIPVGSMYTILTRAVERKSLQFWSANPELAQLFPKSVALDSPGSLDENWLKIVHSNIRGGKSSRLVSQKVSLDVTNSRTSLRITRSYRSNRDSDPEENRNFSEIYIPARAQNIVIQDGKDRQLTRIPIGILPSETSEPLEYSVEKSPMWIKLSFWFTTKKNQDETFSLSYDLENSGQTFFYSKQAGTRNEKIVYNDQEQEVWSNIVLPIPKQ